MKMIGKIIEVGPVKRNAKDALPYAVVCNRECQEGHSQNRHLPHDTSVADQKGSEKRKYGASVVSDQHVECMSMS